MHYTKWLVVVLLWDMRVDLQREREEERDDMPLAFFLVNDFLATSHSATLGALLSFRCIVLASAHASSLPTSVSLRIDVSSAGLPWCLAKPSGVLHVSPKAWGLS